MEEGECLEPVGKAMLIYLILVKDIGIRFFPFVLRLLLILSMSFPFLSKAFFYYDESKAFFHYDASKAFFIMIHPELFHYDASKAFFVMIHPKLFLL